MKPTRRDFIKFVVAGAVTSWCPFNLELLAQSAEKRAIVDSEEHTICHQVRDLIAFDLPRVSAAHDLIIVGGGMSGLTAAYLSPNLDWLLLEKEPDFGGNAYMMDFRGAAYGTGSAFVESPVAAEMAIQLGLKPLPIDNWDGSLIQGEYVPDTWGDGLDLLPYAPRVRENFNKFRQAMLGIDVEKRSRELDNTPFSKFLEGYAPEVKEWFDAYGPSNGARSARRPRRWWLLARSRRWAVKSAMMSAPPGPEGWALCPGDSLTNCKRSPGSACLLAPPLSRSARRGRRCMFPICREAGLRPWQRRR